MLPSHLFRIFLTNSLSQRDLYEAWAARLMIGMVGPDQVASHHPSGVDRKIMGVSFAAKLRHGSTRTCSAAWSRCAHWRCVCAPSPNTGSDHRKCGNATGRGRRCTDATRGFSGRLLDWAFSNPVKRTATTTATAPTTTAATGLAPQPVTASEKSQKAAPSQNRRDRGPYDASAWRQHSDYGRGRGYGRDYAPSW